MIDRVMRAYDREGYLVRPDGSNQGTTAIYRKSDGKFIHTGGGVGAPDILWFYALSQVATINRIFIIGNAAGYSTFVLASIFPDADIDVIDAEIEGPDNTLGSSITRAIISRDFPNVQLTIGRSPDDLDAAMRFPGYDLFFIDGHHVNNQLIADFSGCIPRAANRCVFYLHDVGLCNMYEGYNAILEKYPTVRGHDIPFSILGCKAITVNHPDVAEWMTRMHSPGERIDKNPCIG